MKIHVRHLFVALGAGAATGIGVFWLGLINIGASTGHWAVTDWFLHTAMRQSVRFRADAPPPEGYPSPAMIRRGAGHYETGCAYCHGSPAAPRSIVVREMTPEPPHLSERVDEWSASDLFWIVKHGVKFTGMPAWPARSRDDEIWSVVAFLQAMPEVTPQKYHALAFGDAYASAEVHQALAAADLAPLANCTRCHGLDGRGDPDGAFPRLDIQSVDYLREAMQAYLDGRRFSGIMQDALAGLDDSTLDRLAEHYGGGAEEAESKPEDSADSGTLERGRSIAIRGIPEKNIGACSGCHDLSHGRGRPDFPSLSGQYRNYLELQLKLFAGGAARGGGPFVHLMEEASHGLEEDDIRAVAAWYAAQEPMAP